MIKIENNPKILFRFKGEEQWRTFPEFPTVDNYEHLFFETFMHNHSSSDYIAWEEDMYMWIMDEITKEQFKDKGYDIPTKWQAEDERKRLRQIIINETMEDFYADLTAGKIEFSTGQREQKLESALRQLLDVALLEITGFEESYTFEVCEAALNMPQEYPKETYVFIYSIEVFERNVSDEKNLEKWHNELFGDEIERMTPDEFAERVKDEAFNDQSYWVRFIKM